MKAWRSLQTAYFLLAGLILTVSLPLTTAAKDAPFAVLIDDGGKGSKVYNKSQWSHMHGDGYESDYLINMMDHSFRARAHWSFRYFTQGRYTVYVTWVNAPDMSGSAKYYVYNGSKKIHTQNIDQRKAPSGLEWGGRTWQSLGTFDFTKTKARVAVKAPAGDMISVDAVRIVPEDQTSMQYEYRSIDGYGNNRDHPDWGRAGRQLIRMMWPWYTDGVFTPAGNNVLPSARTVSNVLGAQSQSIPNSRGLTDMVWQWGQFVDHDISLTDTAEPKESFAITIPTGDPSFDPQSTGTKTMSLSRSKWDPTTGTDMKNPRQQLSDITAYIDASNVYGSDAVRAAALRTFHDGKLKTSADGAFPPYNTAGLPNAMSTAPSFFLVGDIRGNEQAGLVSMHTLFVREHNRLAEQIKAATPTLTDEEIYQRARRTVGALMQVVTYEEFLPALLGKKLSPYRGYDPRVNATIANEFSTSGFRFGHSMIPTEVKRLNEDGSDSAFGHLSVRDGFFDPRVVTDQGGIDPILRGLASQHMEEIDTLMIDDLRNFLFGPPGAGGLDLLALNVQRARDHGLPRYNLVRMGYGLAKVTSFSQITTNPDIASKLEALYGHVDNVEAWVGTLAEDHVLGTSVGPLMQAQLVDQFTRLRDGDRFYYENQFSQSEIASLKQTRLSDIIKRNTTIQNLRSDVFRL